MLARVWADGGRGALSGSCQEGFDVSMTYANHNISTTRARKRKSSAILEIVLRDLQLHHSELFDTNEAFDAERKCLSRLYNRVIQHPACRMFLPPRPDKLRQPALDSL